MLQALLAEHSDWGFCIENGMYGIAVRFTD